MQQLVDAVRSTGATQPLMLGGIDYSGDVSGWLAHEPHDPRHQLVAAEHNYGTLGPVRQRRARRGSCDTHRHVPVVMGELGETDCRQGYIDQMMPWADRHGISYVGWAWDVAAAARQEPALIRDYDGDSDRRSGSVSATTCGPWACRPGRSRNASEPPSRLGLRPTATLTPCPSWTARFAWARRRSSRPYEQRVGRINGFEAELEHYTDAELREAADELRERARGGESLDDLLFECFALVREAGRRTMGMRHFDVQLIGGMVLHDGQIAEMKTGEGKTLTATLAVVLNALGGRGVHVVTVNDYLARRDAMWMKPIYDMLGVTVGVLQNMQPYEEKRDAYAADVTYGTNSEFGFDYLRDNMATSLEEKVQHGGRPKPEEGKSPVPHVRDRRRGRQHPDRRGAHAADHLRRARAGRRPLRQVRAAGAADAARQDARRHGPARRRRSSSPTSTTSSTRSTRRSR